MSELSILTELLTDLKRTAADLCDCGFLYFSRDMLGASLAAVYQRPAEAHRLRYLMAAAGDTTRLLVAGQAPERAVSEHEEELKSLFEEAIVKPLCREIETDLRLHLHSVRLVGAVEVNPARTGVRALAPFLRLGAVRCGRWRADVAASVSHFLNASFHNHCAVALHDWKTYGEMRSLARDKYGLRLEELALPGQTLEQGLDVLEIMRNIHLFVAKFAYNLNMQMFVERPSAAQDRRHLNVLAIRHVSNSIRTHGTGFMNTTVNCVYQFLAQKLQVFSQFLFDDHIRSRLLKEARFVAEATRPVTARERAQQAGGDGRPAQFEYPVERAIKCGAAPAPLFFGTAPFLRAPSPRPVTLPRPSPNPGAGSTETYASSGSLTKARRSSTTSGFSSQRREPPPPPPLPPPARPRRAARALRLGGG